MGVKAGGEENQDFAALTKSGLPLDFFWGALLARTALGALFLAGGASAFLVALLAVTPFLAALWGAFGGAFLLAFEAVLLVLVFALVLRPAGADGLTFSFTRAELEAGDADPLDWAVALFAATAFF